MAPAMATTAPTEMSMPPVAITSVMPLPMIITGTAFLSTSTRLPKRWPSFTSTWKKPGVKNRLNSRMAASVSSGQAREEEASRLRREVIGVPLR